MSAMAVIDSLIPNIANARGVICDLRGYPNGNHGLISHLLTGPDTSTHWMGIPKTIYPDRKKSAGYDYTGWQLLPKQPHIGGKVVFLTDRRAISYAESYMGFIEHYKLAEIVGEPTAGTNGNVNPFTLPGGYRLTWTGMRVTKHDGSRHHGVGIQPTVLVHRTVKGIREGKDEQLDVALELINKATR
jgi:C-terminal processing protease CtpA/Prc